MGTKCMGAHLKHESGRVPSVPPGFTSLTSFTLERVEDDVGMTCGLAPSRASESQQSQMENNCSTVNEERIKKSLRQRPWINYSQFDNSSDEESDSELFEHDVPPTKFLTKGVFRGCSDCANCQKVVARWHPEEASRPDLDEAPVFYPSEEEFKDTLKYIASIRSKAEPYGICRIVPPPSWKPPCPLKEKVIWENSKFRTRIQRVDRLQNRFSARQLVRYRSVMNRKRRCLSRQGAEHMGDVEHFLESNGPGYYNNGERFGFEPGPEFTLGFFQKYADDFKKQYFSVKDGTSAVMYNQDYLQRQWEPSVEEIEGEYWRMVEKPTEEIEVLYGADLETGEFGSGFPKASSASLSCATECEYVKSGWNLNNFPRLPGSVLSFESGDISGVLVPWLYVGMCFSSFCWHVEDHHFYSLNYMHWGAPKMWYGVPGKDSLKLETAMKKHLPGLFEEQPDLLHNLVTQFSPSTLKSEGVPVYRCVQHSGEFVLTFPRAYHSGFNCGFNCAEAVNVAPIDWLPHGQNAVELYRDQGRKISVSHDKLLLGAAREAIRAQWNALFLRKTTPASILWKDACGQDKILAKALKARVDMERTRREFLCCSSQSRKMDASFDADERECFICHYDLHLSAVSCSCSSDKFACLNHAKQMCSCDWSMRFFLFRYDISELNILVDALGGKLSAVHRWGVSDLGLSLSTCVTKDKPQERVPATEPSSEEKQKQKLSDSASSDVFSLNAQRCSEKVNQKDTVGNELSILGRPSWGKGTEDQTFQVAEGSSGSLSDLSDNAASHLSRGDRLDVMLQRRSCRVQNPGGHILVTKDKFPINSDETDKCLSAAGDDMRHTGDKEYKVPLQSLSENKKENFKKCVEVLERVPNYDGKVTPSDSQVQVLDRKEMNASVMNKQVVDLVPVVEESGHLSSPHLKANTQGRDADKSMSKLHPLTTGFPHRDSLSRNSDIGTVTKTVQGLLASKQDVDHNFGNNEKSSQDSHLGGIVKANDESKHGKIGLHSVGRLTDRGQLFTESPSCPLNAVDRYNQQKGPRMAKAVRRINCTVEPLELGVVVSGRLWSTSQAIFPKGYRSRVRYFSILDPSQMCFYVSEILDAGLLGPLFMVQVEQHPSEVFIHVSATKCWDMVRERVNHEIRRQHSLGKFNVPTLQPPGSVDGLEMFGFASPEILKAIEAIDQNHVCSEYWRSRPQLPATSTDLVPRVKEEPGIQDQFSAPGSDVIIQGFFKKANPDELLVLHRMLSSDRPSSNQAVLRLLNEEIKRRPKSENSDNT